MICGRKSTLFSCAQELGMVQTDRTTGLPCFEISDHDSRLKFHPDQIAERQEPVVLGDVINHPRLFTAYPFLKRIGVVLISGDKGACTDGSHIFVPFPCPEGMDYHGIFLHEVQHIIQGLEDLPVGTDPALFLRGMETTSVVRLALALAADMEVTDFWNEVEAITLTEYGPQCLSELQEARNLGRSNHATDNKDMPIPGKIPAIVESLIQDAVNLMEAADDTHQLCDGELMAYETQARRPMPPEQRKLVPPLSCTGRAYEIPSPPYSPTYELNHNRMRQRFKGCVNLSQLIRGHRSEAEKLEQPPLMTPDQALLDLDNGPAMLFRSVGTQPYTLERQGLPAVFRSERALPYDTQKRERLGIRRAPLVAHPLSHRQTSQKTHARIGGGDFRHDQYT